MDIMRLMTTGTRQLMSRVVQKTTRLDFFFARPSSCFPFSVLKHVPLSKLRSLTIHSAHLSEKRGHLSLQGGSLLPSEPVASVEELDLDFQLAHRILGSSPPYGALQLSSSFPRLTSLSIRSWCTGLPDGWAEMPARPLLRCWPLHLPPTTFPMPLFLSLILFLAESNTWNSVCRHSSAMDASIFFASPICASFASLVSPIEMYWNLFPIAS